MAVRTLKGTDISAAASYEEAATVSDGDTVIVRSGRVEVGASGITAWNSYTSTGLNLVVMPGASLIFPIATALACKWASISAYGQLVLTTSGNTTKGYNGDPGSVLNFTGGTLAEFIHAAGSLTVGAGCNLTNLRCRGGTAEVAASSGSDRVDVLECYDQANVTLERPVSLLRGMGGVAECRKAATIQDGSAGGAAYLMGRNFTLRMACLAAQTIDTLYAYAGSLDPTRMGGDLTITNATRHAGAAIREAWASGKVVYTNTPTDVGYFAQFVGGGPVA